MEPHETLTRGGNAPASRSPVEPNPLLSREFPVPFDRIRPEHVVPGVREALAAAETELAAIVARAPEPGADAPDLTWGEVMGALDELQERLGRAVGIAYHLVSVESGPELRAAFNEVLPEFSAFFAKLPTHPGLWRALSAYARTRDAEALDPVRRRHLDKTLDDFRRAGADLPEATRERVEAIQVELDELHAKFGENVLDATNAYELILEDEARLAGLPESARAQARAAAEAKGIDGWRFTLHLPSYGPFLQYADERELRREMHQAYVNRASSGDLDNRPLVQRILALRRELATLLGYRDYADLTLETNMVGSGDAAIAFERELEERTRPFWREEVEELEAFARDELGIERLEPWDLAWVTEKVRRARFDLDAEELRPYFPLDRVLEGLFAITGELFGFTVEERPGAPTWHPDVRFYDLRGEDGTHLGSFYADWFPREGKRAGAWMNSFITGGPREDGGFDPHLGLMVGNFTPPQGDRPALLTHREVQTTFHEFGHLLHHLLSRVEVAPLAGTNVPRDWVELPSQLLENWTWERAALDRFARHVDTGEPLPGELYDKMIRARTFMEASAQMRQLSFGSVDLALHVDYDPAAGAEDGSDAIAYGREVMGRFTVRPDFADDHFLAIFTHVFQGGYAAGYYSYKWSEVLEADAFRRFRDAGVFDRATGRAYVDAILSRGDSVEPAQQFRDFMGRDPDMSALLERNLGAARAGRA